ncbi:MAG: cache domain-containing protein [Devosia sp.]|uniref:methyl-accepting chemotaxis protein n=1 Tax=Devosia sp. TaxID=1871048 RepID=UPI0019FD5F12|nr:methyl-accepting chemotaxis protein [Devosia sp.]MBF0680019.1 cache domain-containing protein [Devosia sp.]
MFNLKISSRIYLLVGLMVLALAVTAWIGVHQVNTTRDELRGVELQAITEAAASIVNGQYERFERGEQTEAEARQNALAALQDLRYRGNEYMFVNDLTGIVLMHGTQPDLIGMDQANMADPTGKKFVASMIEIAKAHGAGFDEYRWTRAGGTEAIEKRAYVTLFEPWGWVLGTGVYIDDLRNAARDSMIQMAGLALVIALIVSGVAFLIARTITAPIGRLTGLMGKVAEGQFDVAVSDVGRKDEVGAMARAVEVFRENGLKVAQMTEAEAARIIADQEARQDMMAALQQAFGQVVDAAVDGDFSRRVSAEFPDAELNALAKSVNNLVESVDRGISETQEVLGALANTDLTRRMEGDYRGAFGRLQDDTNAVADKLTEIVTQLRGTSGALKSATREILSGANDLSERTTRQAATIEETSASMEQLAQTVGENARKAADANDKAQAVSRSAEEGGEVMAQANKAMERITDSSAKISNIIGMIDDIAFQTNLLALNASVEAARAGEAGKGFAVVAVEVRRLAQSSAEASSEIKGLIEQSVREVDSGSKLVASAAGKLSNMLDSLRANTSLLDEIARASREQASSIDEVNTAVRQMDEMTQHNAALVEEVNASIEQTEAQASELDLVVDVFTLDASGAARMEVAAKPAPAKKPGPVRAIQQKAKAAAAYLTQGNAAIKQDWSEF